MENGVPVYDPIHDRDAQAGIAHKFGFGLLTARRMAQIEAPNRTLARKFFRRLADLFAPHFDYAAGGHHNHSCRDENMRDHNEEERSPLGLLP
jgi:hypothetical protein